jgi:lipopolysaccharide cholinephosphotransferase
MEIDDHTNKEYKKIALDVFRAFVSICNINGLQYFCAFGTALGAVRDLGMIPWDDDVDVFMPRPDYEKFLLIFKEYHSEKYELITPRNNKSYYLLYAKMCDKNTTLLESEDSSCVVGVFIDIFPLDGLSDNRKKQLGRIKNLKLLFYSSAIRPTFKKFINLLSERKFLLLICVYSRITYLLKTIIVKILHNKCLEYDYNNAETVACFVDCIGLLETYPKAWFESYIQVPFEDFTVRLPKGFDNYLKFTYGNYMVPPPINERYSQHDKAYLNLNERLCMSEIAAFNKHLL